MVTYRLLRQTSRSCRFAKVTVEVAPASETEVDVTATVDEDRRREAVLGARWALRDAAPAKVTVTDVVTTEIDTGTGDVYEATARAVWEALSAVPYVGFSDPLMVTAWLGDMVGQRLLDVTGARYRGEGPPHAWLHFEHAVAVGLHGRGDTLLLAKEYPYPAYDETRAGPASRPDVLAGFVGGRLVDGAIILGHEGEAVCAGLVLRFDRGDLVIGSLGDEWVLAVDTAPEALSPHWTTQPFVRGPGG
ncbi:hypothetical protein [Actinoplanes palleronii]|nr:hypothetical protein [Actinoplanes palleronii]